MKCSRLSYLLLTSCFYAGLFAGFNQDSAQQFFIEDASRVKRSYDLTRLCLPQESADICLIKHTGQPYFGQYSHLFVLGQDCSGFRLRGNYYEYVGEASSKKIMSQKVAVGDKSTPYLHDSQRVFSSCAASYLDFSSMTLPCTPPLALTLAPASSFVYSQISPQLDL